MKFLILVLLIAFVIDKLVSWMKINFYNKVLDWCQSSDIDLIIFTEKLAYVISTFFSKIPTFIYEERYAYYDGSKDETYTKKEKILLLIKKIVEFISQFIGFRLFYLFLIVWFIFHFHPNLISGIKEQVYNILNFEIIHALKEVSDSVVNNINYILLFISIFMFFKYKSSKHNLNRIKLEKQKEEYEKVQEKQKTLETNLYQIREHLLYNINIIHSMICYINQYLGSNNDYFLKKLEISKSLKEYNYLSKQNSKIIFELRYKENFSIFIRHNKKVLRFLSKLYFSEINFGNMSSPLLSCNSEDIENIVRNNVEDYRVMRELLIIKLKDGIIISHTIQRYLYGLNKNYLKFEKMRNNIEILERFKSEITDLKE